MPFAYESPWSPHANWFPLRSRHQGTTGSSSGVIIAKMAKSAVSGDRPGYETLAILLRQALIHDP